MNPTSSKPSTSPRSRVAAVGGPYFFLIGLSYAPSWCRCGPRVPPRGWLGISRLALLAALVCGLTAPVALLATCISPPLRHFYAYFTPTRGCPGRVLHPVYLTG